MERWCDCRRGARSPYGRMTAYDDTGDNFAFNASAPLSSPLQSARAWVSVGCERCAHALKIPVCLACVRRGTESNAKLFSSSHITCSSKWRTEWKGSRLRIPRTTTHTYREWYVIHTHKTYYNIHTNRPGEKQKPNHVFRDRRLFWSRNQPAYDI